MGEHEQIGLKNYNNFETHFVYTQTIAVAIKWRNFDAILSSFI